MTVICQCLICIFFEAFVNGAKNLAVLKISSIDSIRKHNPSRASALGNLEIINFLRNYRKKLFMKIKILTKKMVMKTLSTSSGSTASLPTFPATP